MKWTLILMVAAAGAMGALARLGVVLITNSMLGHQFPWGTVCVNVVGCFLFGLVFSISPPLSDSTKLIVLGGFMGAFTTFSTFAFESVEAMQRGFWFVALGNIALQNTLGLVSVAAGISLGRWIH